MQLSAGRAQEACITPLRAVIAQVQAARESLRPGVVRVLQQLLQDRLPLRVLVENVPNARGERLLLRELGPARCHGEGFCEPMLELVELCRSTRRARRQYTEGGEGEVGLFFNFFLFLRGGFRPKFSCWRTLECSIGLY